MPERLCPLNHHDDLRYVEPDQIKAEDLDSHMPTGMTTHYPPDDNAQPRSRR
jgi:hypothetical protein